MANGTLLIIDAGTGIRRLGQRLAQQPLHPTYHLLISHTHWDHIHGLPFFAPLYLPDREVHIYACQRDVHLQTLLSKQTRDPYFPVGLEDGGAKVTYHELSEDSCFKVAGAQVRCARLNHPYIAVGYRIDADGTSVAYISDTAPFDSIVLGYQFVADRPDPNVEPAQGDAAILADMRAGVVGLCKAADLVIFDTMFEPAEYRRYAHWGHSTPKHAVEIAEQAAARCLALFHHHPDRTDEQQLAIADKTAAATTIKVIAATEGMEVECESGALEVRA